MTNTTIVELIKTIPAGESDNVRRYSFLQHYFFASELKTDDADILRVRLRDGLAEKMGLSSSCIEVPMEKATLYPFRQDIEYILYLSVYEGKVFAMTLSEVASKPHKVEVLNVNEETQEVTLLRTYIKPVTNFVEGDKLDYTESGEYLLYMSPYMFMTKAVKLENLHKLQVTSRGVQQLATNNTGLAAVDLFQEELVIKLVEKDKRGNRLAAIAGSQLILPMSVDDTKVLSVTQYIN